MNRIRLFTSLIALLALTGTESKGSQYHYKNVLVGDRAAGLGGAFAAVSDDPSGVYYNPAGLAFCFENYFSGSANTYTLSEEKYLNVFPGKDYKFNTGGLIPSFFGLTQTFGRTKLGFAIIVPNSDLIDQNDLLENISTKDNYANTLKRRLFRRDTTYMVGPSIARELAENFAVGLSVFGAFRFDQIIDQQVVLYNPMPSGQYAIFLSDMTRKSIAVIPRLGIQFMPRPKWSVGIAASRPINISGSGTFRSTAPNFTTVDGTSATTTVPVTYTGSYSNDINSSRVNGVSFPSKFPEVFWFTLGNAFFFSKKFMLSADFDYYTAQQGYSEYPIAATWNASLGSEIYLSDSTVLRLGAYTNRANTSSLSTTKTDQSPNVNFWGGSSAIAFVRPGSSFSLGLSYLKGSGQGQVVAGTTSIQEITSYMMTVFISGSYQL
jgi:long-chain fatty acid transport protein